MTTILASSLLVGCTPKDDGVQKIGLIVSTLNNPFFVDLKTGIEKAYSKENFDKTDMIIIGESIGEKNEFDLIPFEGEWFAIVVAECIK